MFFRFGRRTSHQLIFSEAKPQSSSSIVINESRSQNGTYCYSDFSSFQSHDSNLRTMIRTKDARQRRKLWKGLGRLVLWIQNFFLLVFESLGFWLVGVLLPSVQMCRSKPLHTFFLLKRHLGSDSCLCVFKFRCIPSLKSC